MNKEIVSLGKTTEKHPVVLIFLSAECPISQKYILTLNALSKKNPEIKFLGIFTQWDKIKVVRDFKNEYQTLFPVFSDFKNSLVKAIDAQITPEVFFYDNRNNLLYRGAIDDWYFALGEHKSEANNHYLSDAIECFNYKRDIKIKYNQPTGCIIER